MQYWTLCDVTDPVQIICIMLQCNAEHFVVLQINLPNDLTEIKQLVLFSVQYWTLSDVSDPVQIISFMLQCNVGHFVALQNPPASVAVLKQHVLCSSAMLDTLWYCRPGLKLLLY